MKGGSSERDSLIVLALATVAANATMILTMVTRYKATMLPARA
jgi:hypothetical protein